MELGLYTDSVPALTLDETLDLAVEIGCSAVEIAAGGQSAAPHMDVFSLVSDAKARAEYDARIRDRGLRWAAVNCSAWPMHPTHGAHHLEIMKAAVTLAGQLGVDKIVTMSGCPGEGAPDARLFNWVFYPWPPEAMDMLARQWEETVAFWEEFVPFAADHGVTRIALELHPMHLVYNVPTLRRLREAVGPAVGANIDPSHTFWQRMDAPAMVRDLGDAVHHVHLKDVSYRPEQVALAGVLDSRPFADPDQRAWTFTTVGRGHGPEYWGELFRALSEVGYDDVACIENEDPVQPAVEGVTEAAEFAKGLLTPVG
ncbi:sugar phosphate isomerase/epimerase family protein [Pseudonocardia pini]|uniref:sugar phosphate isomerase/epimerase family protein n=1 Tax=Pseudonocardia pini TaxID=2758030 RepID=UPI0015F0A425|nr:sugar phosphate isomerase/epimerase [Pseudonocardia pini]